MKKILLLGFLFAVLYGCKSPVPKEIIQSAEMQKILYDIHLVDGYINLMPNQDSAKKVAAAYYKGIYKKFGIDSANYTRSLTFYQNNPEIMNEMYKGIQDDIKKNKLKVEKVVTAFEKKESKRKLDSVKADSLYKSKLSKKERDSVLKIQKVDSLKKAKKMDSLQKLDLRPLPVPVERPRVRPTVTKL